MAAIGHNHEQDQTPHTLIATAGRAHLNKEGKVIVYLYYFCEVQRKYYGKDWCYETVKLMLGFKPIF